MVKKAGKARMRISPIGIYDGPNTTCHFPKRGFTLMELIVVLFIISLLIGIVFPTFYGVEEKRLKSDARRIASVLRYLNDSAISTKKTYFLKFDLSKGSISWDGPEGVKTEHFRSLTSLELPSKGEVKEGEIILFFGPFGVEENIAVHLRTEEEGMKVTFSPVSGRAKIIQDIR